MGPAHLSRKARQSGVQRMIERFRNGFGRSGSGLRVFDSGPGACLGMLARIPYRYAESADQPATADVINLLVVGVHVMIPLCVMQFAPVSARVNRRYSC